MAAYRRVYDSHTCRLTAKNPDQLRNPALGSRVWATFTFLPRIALRPHYEYSLRQSIQLFMFYTLRCL